MKVCRACEQEKALSAFGVDRSRDDGKSIYCAECGRSMRKEWRANNRDKARSHWLKSGRKYRLKRNAALKVWKAANPEKVAARKVADAFVKAQASPAWANRGAIHEFYREAMTLTKRTGVRHQVDHMVPLKGEAVCGLHVEHNLRVITAFENGSKKNRFVPEVVYG